MITTRTIGTMQCDNCRATKHIHDTAELPKGWLEATDFYGHSHHLCPKCNAGKHPDWLPTHRREVGK
jgi:hypothetical protein